jgi:hypothetical protein
MNTPLDRQTLVFIVRIWAEYLKEQPPCWRGVVELVDQGETVPFNNVVEMAEVIKQNTILEFNIEDINEIKAK